MSAASRTVRTVAVVIGRAGSKGLPGKNSRPLPFGGKPCAAYTIHHALAARLVDRVIVSTDCATMAAIAVDAHVDVINRPAALAGDTATVDSAVRHAVEQSGERGEAAIVVMLYANVPIRPADLVDRAVARLIETGADSVQSYCAVGKHHPYWMVKLDEQGRVSANVANTVYRRQDLPPLHVPDGGVIAVTCASLFTVREGEPHAFLGGDRRGIQTRPGDVVDIDDASDALLAGALMMRGPRNAGTEVACAPG